MSFICVLGGCDVRLGGPDGFGCIGSAAFSGLSSAIAGAFGAFGDSVQSDSGGHVAKVYCGDGNCDNRAVLSGSSLLLEMDVTEAARDTDEGATPDPDDIMIESSAPDVLQIDEMSTAFDACTGHVSAAAAVTFRDEGEAAIVLNDRETERARFTFEVHDAASIELEASYFDQGFHFLTMRETLTGAVGRGASLTAFVRSEHGVLLSTGGDVHFWVDDPEIADIDARFGGLGSNGQGESVVLWLKRPGATRVHALVSNLTATIDVVVTEGPPPPPQDEDAGALDDEDAGVASADEVQP